MNCKHLEALKETIAAADKLHEAIQLVGGMKKTAAGVWKDCAGLTVSTPVGYAQTIMTPEVDDKELARQLHEAFVAELKPAAEWFLDRADKLVQDAWKNLKAPCET